MSKEFHSPLQDTTSKVKEYFDLSSFEISIDGEMAGLTTILKGFESAAIDEKGFLTPSAKNKSFINAFLKVVASSTEEIGGLWEALMESEDKESLNIILRKDSSENNSVEGFKDSATNSDVKSTLIELDTLIRTYLMVYVDEGVLTIEGLSSKNVDSRLVDEIEKQQKTEALNEFDLWKSTAHDITEIKSLSNFLKNEPTRSVDLVKSKTEFDDFILGLKPELVSAGNFVESLSLEKKEYLEKEYLTSSRGVLDKTVLILKEIDGELLIKNSYEDFSDKIEDIESLILKIPPGSIEEIRTSFGKEKFSEVVSPLKTIKKDIEDEWERLEKSRLLVKRPASTSASEKINADIEDVQGRRKEAMAKISGLVSEAETPPVSHMSIEELADEIIAQGWDPFLWKEQKYQHGEGRMKPVIQTFKRLAFARKDNFSLSVQENEENNTERVVQKVRVQLQKWDDKGIHETGKASTHRGVLEEEMNNNQMSRGELLLATTYHPEWGEDIREILDYCTKFPTLYEGEALVGREVDGEVKEVKLLPGEPMIAGDVEIYKHHKNVDGSTGFEYQNLAGEAGRDILGERIEQEFPDVEPIAKTLATLMFTSMDMLSIPLMQRQLKTATRAHNGGIGGTDYISLWNPLAAYVHRSERYGGVTADWSGWWLYFLENIEEGENRLGRQIKQEEEDSRAAGGQGREYEAQYLHEKQHLIKLHQESYFDGSGSRSEIPLMDYCDSYFPHTLQMFYLGEKETLNVEGVVINGEEAVVGGGQNLSAFDLYFVAENGWKAMLELTYQDIPTGITYEDILEKMGEDGGKGGILNKFFGSAGAAKMFPGNHLEMALGPLLLHLIRRIFSQYRGRGERAEMRLFNGVIKSIEDSMSGGLASYKNILSDVIGNISGPVYGKMSNSLVKRDEGGRNKETEEYMSELYEEEYQELPPRNIFGIGMVLDASPEKKNYLAVLRNDPSGHIERPLTRSGNMIQKEE